MSQGRILAVDYGAVRIGLAISDAERRIASPLTTCTRRGPEADADFFRRLVEEEQVERIVVGLPVHLDGGEGASARAARELGAWLAATCERPVAYFDERFTTVHAEAALWQAGLTHKRRKERRDRVAAQILLQAYLEAGCPVDSGERGASC